MPKLPASTPLQFIGAREHARARRAIQLVDRIAVVAQCMASSGFGARGHQAGDEMRLRVVRQVPAHHLVVHEVLLAQIERVQRLPVAADLRVQRVGVIGTVQPERLVRRRLLDAGLEAQRCGQRHAAEADVCDVAVVAQTHQQHHVAVRGRHAVGHVPAHARAEALHAQADLLERAAEQQVVLETVAATPARDQLVLQRCDVELDRLAEQRRKILERDVLGVQRMQLPQGLERRRCRAAVADAIEIRVELDVYGRHLSGRRRLGAFVSVIHCASSHHRRNQAATAERRPRLQADLRRLGRPERLPTPAAGPASPVRQWRPLEGAEPGLEQSLRTVRAWRGARPSPVWRGLQGRRRRFGGGSIRLCGAGQHGRIRNTQTDARTVRLRALDDRAVDRILRGRALPVEHHRHANGPLRDEGQQAF